jgi:hypothetical protein
LALSEQAGHIDGSFVRRLLDDDEEAESSHRSGLMVELSDNDDRSLVAWSALGCGRWRVWFPLLIEGDIPSDLTAMNVSQRLSPFAGRLDQDRSDRVHEALSRLQARFDQETDDFSADTGEWRRQGRADELRRQATLFMQHCLERFEEVADGLAGRPRPSARRSPVESVNVFEG